MTKNELCAWLLLAGFKQHHQRNRYSHLDRYADYIVVEFLMAGRIEVGRIDKRRRFLFPKRAQQYIQELIGDRHADISSV